VHTGDTIIAPASAPAQSDRAILRISGPGTRRLLAAALDHAPADPGAHKVRLKSPRLPALLAFFAAGRSYTGQDAAELYIPGNPHLVNLVIGALLAAGGAQQPRAEAVVGEGAAGREAGMVRRALPGEFTARAYLNDKLSLEQAEGVAQLIAARTGAQLDAARRLLAGASGERFRGWVDELTTLLALVEAGIDFTDQEDVVPIPPRDLAARTGALLSRLEAALASTGGSEAREALPRVVVAGEPNAGKSTLFNALLGRRRAVESPEAGTTRDALAETLNLSRDLPGAGSVTLIDIAGLDHAIGATDTVPPTVALHSPDLQAQQRAAETIRSADAVIHCDPTGRFRLLPDVPPDAAIIRVRTKADLAELSKQPRLPEETARHGVAGYPESHRRRQVAGCPEPADSAQAPDHAAEPLSVCALDGWRVPALRRAIADAAGRASAGEDALLLPRHAHALSAAAAGLGNALTLIEGTATDPECVGGPGPGPGSLSEPELIAQTLREALDALTELTGRVSPDDVIGRIFATFCVGK
jgi:tRNA modification GTPase